MRRIKEYINNHPKLKRIVKILGVVAIVFSFLFNAVIIASAIATANNDSVKPPLTYNEINQPVKCVYKTSTSVTIGIDELCNADYYSQLMTCFNAYCDDFSSDTWQVPMYCEMKIMNFSGTQDLLDGSYNSFLVRHHGDDIYLMFYQHISTNNWLVMGSYIGTYNNLYYCFSAQFTYNGSNIYQVPLEPFSLSSNVLKHYSIEAPYWYVENLGLVNPLYEYLGENKRVASDINDAYNNGIQQGSTAGYKTGYDAGYLAGLEDASQGGVEANAFTLISQAFHAIADILNIQVLPHLTLGVLIFAPLIITLIIVIVKMVRG